MASLTVNIEPGTPRLHLWCDRCLTSAAFEVDLYLLASDGPRRIGTVAGCARCDYQDQP
jgi:hypothetical protein